MGRLDWLRGKTTEREQADSIGRAGRHRKQIAKAAEKWERKDRARFGR
jgi:hypothetical protein